MINNTQYIVMKNQILIGTAIKLLNDIEAGKDFGVSRREVVKLQLTLSDLQVSLFNAYKPEKNDV